MLEDFLPRMPYFIAIILSFLWIRYSVLYRHEILKILRENKIPKDDYETEVSATRFTLVVATLSCLVLSSVFGMQYANYPNFVFAYTLFCTIGHLGFDLPILTAKATISFYMREKE